MNEKYKIYNVTAALAPCNEYYPDCIAFLLDWNSNLGFGQLLFIYNTKTKQWDYDSEYMSEEFCVAVLNKWLNDVLEGNDEDQ